MKKYVLKAVLPLAIILCSFHPANSKKETEPEFPVPEGIDNMLFYVHRTVNTNTIVYTLNISKEGKLNELEPIKVFWIKYAQGGKIAPLTFIQRKYAYGIKAKLYDKEKKSFRFEFVSYGKRHFYLMKSPSDNQYHAYGYINNRLTILNNIIVRVDGGTFWVPNVTSVEVYAKDPATSTTITEIIKP